MRFGWLLIALSTASGQVNETPLALVLDGGSAQILRLNSELSLSAKPGDILFAGDVLRAAGGPVTLLSCTANTRQTLSSDAELVLEARGPKLRAGKIARQDPAPGCFLPAMPRNIIASRQDAGAAETSSREAPAAAGDPLMHLQRADELDRQGRTAEAADEMRQVGAAWPDAGWVRSRLFVLESPKGAPPQSSNREGQTFAVLVGISKFQDPNIPPLQFAHQDAIELTRLLESPRAGGIPPANVVLLTNEKATRSAIQSAIETNLKARAGPNDTVILFVASHGVTMHVPGRGTQGFIATYDSHPQDLATSAVPMDDVRSLFEGQLSHVKRLLLYVDVCHAGHVGEIELRSDETNKTAERSLFSDDLQMFGMLAAQGHQVAIEGPDFGGGHGAFSYFLLRALNGDADANKDGMVDMPELWEYVQHNVSATTAKKQIPKQIGDLDEKRIMANVRSPGIELRAYTGQIGVQALPPTVRSITFEAPETESQFEEALGKGNILPLQPGSAFAFLPELRARLGPEDYSVESEKLRTALEDQGQQVLLRYLAGEAVPQTHQDFIRGSEYFEAAQRLSPDSLYLESKRVFCQGRAAIFEKDYRRATDLLERAVRLDPERAYSYNALGIAYLEQADYDRAILAFRDAADRAPYWAYPLHNLALTLAERGDFDASIRTYQAAINRAPRVAYLPYNLGLTYQRMNRRADAEAMYRLALKLDPQNPNTLNALGYLKSSEGKTGDAEKFYRAALEKDSGSLVARHNLAVLVSGIPGRSSEAIELFRANLPDYLPSRLSLARLFARLGQDSAAEAEYTALIERKPDYVAARLALADLQLKAGRGEAALAQLQAAAELSRNPEIQERKGDVLRTLRRSAEASEAYRVALEAAMDGAMKKRLQKKIAGLH